MSGGNLLANELYRLGGFRSLRGFDEESIPVRWYHTGTVELRYLLGSLSYAALFADGGLVSRRATDGYVEDVPIGIGAGLNFQTKAGIFSLNYAVGRNSSSTFDFRAAKIHFGYVTVF
jgi:hemolysin activation/secretion protein